MTSTSWAGDVLLFGSGPPSTTNGVTLIEGNSSDQVRRVTHTLPSDDITAGRTTDGVTVEVYPGGPLSSLSLTSGALSLRQDVLATTIVEAVAEAAAVADQRAKHALRAALDGLTEQELAVLGLHQGVEGPVNAAESDEFADERAVDDLDDLDDLNGRADTLFTGLAGIECTARDEGVEATVNLEGRLTGLTLSAEAVALHPDDLAERIFRLTQDASASALAEGLDALAPVVGEDVTARLRAEIDDCPPALSPLRSRS